ncbi:MAG: ABC transporter permease [Lachnospiraceae bacterium]|jgi:oligopeptide transport system permease protein|nr:ABC transporter permease [Lachnospiraceae bacterium]
MNNDFQFHVHQAESLVIDRSFAGDSFFKAGVKRFFARKSNVFGLVLLCLLIIMSIIGPHLSGWNYSEQHLDRANMAPRIPGILSGEENLPGTNGSIRVNRYEQLGLTDTYYYFGTDELGRDLFSRCFQGLRVSVLIALAAALIDLVIGINYGMISGYFGGKVDLCMQQIIDIAGSIPTLVVVTLLMLVLKPGIGTIIFALMLTGWMEMSIIARTQVLKLKEEEFVLASRTLGAGRFFILFKEILPNITGALITEIMVSIPSAIFLETFLSFVGLGLPIGSCSLGSLISSGFDSCLLHPYKLFPSMIVLILLMIACNLVADGLREAFDTRSVR